MKNNNRNKNKKPLAKQEKAATKTLFILLIPTIIIAGIAIAHSTVGVASIVVVLAIWQFLMTRQFAEYYHKNE